MIEEIRTAIFPLYEKLLTQESFEDVCTFCLQWGNNFPIKAGEGILVVGKAVNGWQSNETNPNKIFDINNNNRIFARDDQMVWVNNLWEHPEYYNTKKSAFWRVTKRISEKYYHEQWYSNIAWTNLYKIAPYVGGNPNSHMQSIQLDSAREILRTELEILKPRFVIMLTSGWEQNFLDYLNAYNQVIKLSIKNWKKYSTYLTKINGIKFIISQHPQGKNENLHYQAITELIDENWDR
ncbi:hypothetical protein OU798_02770 [Prolixibacteraceae bacterium Z1-6]|uniref:Uracil-DNA glycosylase-like domain-containing protein n=1 Tax=Draconibacterium aestuarii TaxID=2998507 RepID=A0A9X3F2B4_9BACT|nr:hypothetical protein [Prolixibacteraceae bacterium Z1-6]